MMDVAEEIKLAQGSLRKEPCASISHTFWQSFTRNMSHNSLCSLPLFCSILGARCHQEKLAQAFSDTWCRLSPKACASFTSRKSLIKYDDLIIIEHDNSNNPLRRWTLQGSLRKDSLRKEACARSSGRTTSLEELKALLNRSSHNFSESNLWT